MANNLLTPLTITRKSLKVLHQKLNLIGAVNRQYDDSFARTGGKIGDTLRVRLPNEFLVTDGRTLVIQDVDESGVDVKIEKQFHVGMDFTSKELTLNIDDFTDRYIEPAMARLAAAMESWAFGKYLPGVYNTINRIGSPLTFTDVLNARKILTDNLAPTNDRNFILNTQANVDLVTDTKTLFNDQPTIGRQYREGKVGYAAGFDFWENTLFSDTASGSSTTATTVGAVTANGSTAATLSAATTLKAGDVITFAGVFRVNQETKAVTNTLQQFVVAADLTAGTALTFSPAIYTTGARQNVAATGIPGGSTLTKVGAASAVYRPSLAFQKDALTFVTADLVMPEGAHFAARETMDGIRMRIVRNYDINNDSIPCRVDVLFGGGVIRPQHAVRVLTN